MITSTTNPLVKNLVRLRTRRNRDRRQRFLIDGRRPLELAAGAGIEIESQIICVELGGSAVGNAPVIEMAEAPFRKASIRQNPDGVMAVAKHLDTDLKDLAVPSDGLVLMVEGLEKPGNLGAMLRTAAAVGTDAVIVCDPTTDVHNPSVVRASQGAVFKVPIGVGDLETCLSFVDRAGLRIIATSPDSSASLWDCDLRGGIVVTVGAETTGLTAAALGAADETIRIPSTFEVDSLNVSVAAAVVLYEAARQRTGAGSPA